jgi:polyisoprenoid-binding protein YceI
LRIVIDEVSVIRGDKWSTHLVELALLVAALLVASGAFAQETSVELDPAQTQVEFTLGATLHTVHGTFKLKHGAVKFDPATGRASGALMIDATSGDPDSSGRDHKMDKDVLESAQYAEITFAPQRVEGRVAARGESSFKLVSTFSIHGATHPVALAVHADIKGDRVVAGTSFVGPYVSWGLKNPSAFVLHVSETVDVTIRAVGQIQTFPTY